MKLKLLLFSVLFLGAFGDSFAHQSAMHPYGQIRYVRMLISKKAEPCYSAYLQLRNKADSLLGTCDHALADFSVPGFYIDPEGHRKSKRALSDDGFAAYACALAYRLSDDRRYGEKACFFLDAWASKNQSYSGADGELVMTYSGTALLIAAELMFDSPIWEEADRQKFNYWVERVYRQAANSIRIRKNNWGDWGRFGSLLCASLFNDDKELSTNIKLIKSDLEQRIAPDGRMIEEIKRGKNGIWYSYFSLTPITASCWIIYNSTGENLFISLKEGARIKSALDYLLYYSKHPSEWKWFSNPRSGENEPWPENLFEAMSGIYKEKDYIDFVKDERPIVYSFHHYAWTFPSLMPLMIGPYPH